MVECDQAEYVHRMYLLDYDHTSTELTLRYPNDKERLLCFLHKKQLESLKGHNPERSGDEPT